MKKVIGLFLVTMLALTGCSSNSKNKSVTCSLKNDEGNMSYVIGYDNDKILQSLEMNVEISSEEEIAEEEFKAMTSLYDSVFSKTEGIDFEMSLGGNKKDIKMNVVLDLKKYDAEADPLGMFNAISDKGEIKKLKVTQLVENFEQGGATCGEVK